MGKNIVICCDGTGNEYGHHNTNVVAAFERIERNNHQVGFYDPGVGTFDVFGFKVAPIFKKVGKTVGLAFGTGLVQNVEDAYEYLMDKFNQGDQVYIFGFSRGAFTARVLAGMLNKCGLLQKGSVNLISYASQLNFAKNNHKQAAGFKSAFCHECKPHFIGVWDTVASLGYVHALRKFSDCKLNHDVRHAYHAISIDEKRKKFPVSLWDESSIPDTQTIEQVWFAGVHSDIGGSYKERGLSDITLEWMLTQAERKGLLLKENWRDELGLDAYLPVHQSRKGLWRLWRPVDRNIPMGSNIHQSVIQKIKGSKEPNQPDYTPQLPDKYQVVDSKYLSRV